MLIVRRDEINDSFLKILTHVIVVRPMQCADHFLIVPTRYVEAYALTLSHLHW
jgi:hypothetical protein